MKKTILFLLVAAQSFLLQADPRPGYYENAAGKINDNLRKALQTIISTGHRVTSYNGLWDAYGITDINPETGKIWDMYSNCTFTLDTDRDRGSGGSSECQYYNREHSIPQSWFGGIAPMYSDAFHVVPADKKVNNVRNNFPFGEVNDEKVTYTSNNGCRLGTSGLSSYSGTVFEPTDSYKGDFARIYFYMATRYADKCNSWGNGIFGSQNLGLTSYAVDLFLKWHREDPVSVKETVRNDNVEEVQSNRNPFVDYPDLVEYIWGNKKGEVWDFNTSVNLTKVEFTLTQNPVKNYLRINTNESNLTFTIYDVSGQVIKTGLLEGQSISVSDIQNGLYLIQLQVGTKNSIRKFIIDK